MWMLFLGQLWLPKWRWRSAERGQQREWRQHPWAPVHPAGHRRRELEHKVPQDGAALQDCQRAEGLQLPLMQTVWLKLPSRHKQTNIWNNWLTFAFHGIPRTALWVQAFSLHSTRCPSLGLPGGACASARVPAEELWDREQEVKGPTGGAAESKPRREKRAGGHCPRTPGAAVSNADRKWTRFYLLCCFFVFFLMCLFQNVCQDKLDSVRRQPPG